MAGCKRYVVTDNSTDGELNGPNLDLLEKVLKSMPNSQDAKAKQILEINPNHELFTTLETLYLNDKNSVEKYAKILYNQALLIEGLPLEDPAEFSKLMVELMIAKEQKADE